MTRAEAILTLARAELDTSTCGDLDQPLPDGTFAVLSVAAGHKALDRLGDDDQDRHSLFTRVLLARLDEGGSVVSLARAVRDEVSETALSVRYPQTPTALYELVGTLVTLGPGSDDSPTAQPAPRAPSERAERAPASPPVRERASQPPAAGGFACGAVAPGPPSFDCRHARRFTEAAICRDPRLGSCDRILNGLFEEAQARAVQGAAGLRRDQDAWLVRRDACAEVAPRGAAAVADCIGLAYEERIAALETARALSAAAAQPSPGFSCRYARTPVERIICADPELAAKDRRMARLYERAEGSRFGPVDPTQRDCLTVRDTCARAGGDALQACPHGVHNGGMRQLGGEHRSTEAMCRNREACPPTSSIRHLSFAKPASQTLSVGLTRNPNMSCNIPRPSLRRPARPALPGERHRGVARFCGSGVPTTGRVGVDLGASRSSAV